MTFEELKDSFLGVRIYRSKDVYAPHKPLLLLVVLSQFYAERKQNWLYEEVHDRMIELLRQFSPFTDSYQPNYPFLKLVNDGIWHVTSDQEINTKLEHSAAKLKNLHAKGAFTEEINETLIAEHKRIPELIGAILSEFFPETVHDEILEMVGFYETVLVKTRRKRDPYFRELVLSTYGYKCAVCGLGARLGNDLVGLEAAHIKWFQAGGPDTISNGIALCSMHHKLFDRGAYAFSNDHHLVASSKIHNGNQLEEILFRYQGRQIQLPLNPNEKPESIYLNWHWKNIFKRPVRYFEKLNELNIAADKI
ncbi:MAG: HNH endonuclease [Bacteroidales bacterium]